MTAGGRVLRGDEIGVLVADHLLAHGRARPGATTLVSSSMLAKVAASYGVALLRDPDRLQVPGPRG